MRDCCPVVRVEGWASVLLFLVLISTLTYPGVLLCLVTSASSLLTYDRSIFFIRLHAATVLLRPSTESDL